MVPQVHLNDASLAIEKSDASLNDNIDSIHEVVPTHSNLVYGHRICDMAKIKTIHTILEFCH